MSDPKFHFNQTNFHLLFLCIHPPHVRRYPSSPVPTHSIPFLPNHSSLSILFLDPDDGPAAAAGWSGANQEQAPRRCDDRRAPSTFLGTRSPAHGIMRVPISSLSPASVRSELRRSAHAEVDLPSPPFHPHTVATPCSQRGQGQCGVAPSEVAATED